MKTNKRRDRIFNKNCYKLGERDKLIAKTIIRCSPTHTGGTQPASNGEAVSAPYPNYPSTDIWNYANIHLEISEFWHTNQLAHPEPSEKCKWTPSQTHSSIQLRMITCWCTAASLRCTNTHAQGISGALNILSAALLLISIPVLLLVIHSSQMFQAGGWILRSLYSPQRGAGVTWCRDSIKTSVQRAEKAMQGLSSLCACTQPSW